MSELDEAIHELKSAIWHLIRPKARWFLDKLVWIIDKLTWSRK